MIGELGYLQWFVGGVVLLFTAPVAAGWLYGMAGRLRGEEVSDND